MFQFVVKFLPGGQNGPAHKCWESVGFNEAILVLGGSKLTHCIVRGAVMKNNARTPWMVQLSLTQCYMHVLPNYAH